MLSVRDLAVSFQTRKGEVEAVRNVSFELETGEILGIVGESGAGKSMAGNAVIGLLSPPAHISDGEIHVNGARVDHLQGEDMRRLRGKEIGMVFQEPMTALNPIQTIGAQVAETIRIHEDVFLCYCRSLIFNIGSGADSTHRNVVICRGYIRISSGGISGFVVFILIRW